MKKHYFTYLILTGITSGILASNLNLSAEKKNGTEGTGEISDSDFMELVANSGGNITYHLLSEDELLLQLNEEGAELYQSLTPEGKRLALNIASRSCNGTNSCQGENACRTAKNKCAGEGQCAGQTKCAFSDKNLAVKVAAKKMAAKRAKAINN